MIPWKKIEQGMSTVFLHISADVPFIAHPFPIRIRTVGLISLSSTDIESFE